MISRVTVTTIASLAILTPVLAAAIIHRTLVLICAAQTLSRSRDLAGAPVMQEQPSRGMCKGYEITELRTTD